MLLIETPRLKIIPLPPEMMRKLLSGTPEMENALGLAPSGLELDAHTHEAMEYLAGLAAKTPDSFPWITNWQIIWKERNVSVGSACFMSVPDGLGSIETGYGIYPEFQGRGFMTEALSAILRWAFARTDGPRTVTAETGPENTASRRVLEKCGFARKDERHFIRRRNTGDPV